MKSLAQSIPVASNQSNSASNDQACLRYTSSVLGAMESTSAAFSKLCLHGLGVPVSRLLHALELIPGLSGLPHAEFLRAAGILSSMQSSAETAGQGSQPTTWPQPSSQHEGCRVHQDELVGDGGEQLLGAEAFAVVCVLYAMIKLHGRERTMLPFEYADVDGTESITANQLAAVFAQFGIFVSLDHIITLFDSMDHNLNQRVTSGEFLAYQARASVRNFLKGRAPPGNLESVPQDHTTSPKLPKSTHKHLHLLSADPPEDVSTVHTADAVIDIDICQEESTVCGSSLPPEGPAVSSTGSNMEEGAAAAATPSLLPLPNVPTGVECPSSSGPPPLGAPLASVSRGDILPPVATAAVVQKEVTASAAANILPSPHHYYLNFTMAV